MSLKKKTLMAFATVFLLVMLMPVIGSAQGDAPKSANTLTPVDAGMVDRIEVLLIDEPSNFRIAVTPDFIEKNYDIKYSIRNEYASTLLALINEQVAKAKATTSRQNYDFRYAVIMYDGKGNRLLSLYIDNLSSNGLLDAKGVQFDPSFKKLLRDWHPSVKDLNPSASR